MVVAEFTRVSWEKGVRTPCFYTRKFGGCPAGWGGRWLGEVLPEVASRSPRQVLQFSKMRTLHDKVVLITGASSGIGRATALRLARGKCRLGLAARSQAALEEAAQEVAAAGGQALVLPTDVTQADQCRQAVEATVARFGRLDVVLCSAGLSLRGPFAQSQLAALEQVMRVNFFGTLYITHFALPHVRQSRGSLVAISSLTGLRGVPSYALYGASKFAVRGLYEALRLELKREGVHVGVVYPGFVATPLREKVLGPDGKPWPEPPPPPFRIWPVEKCVDRIICLVQRRQAQALLPAFTGPLLVLDEVLGRWIGDYLLTWKFPPAPSCSAGSP
jgi:dehydrogenase/reductase SDR family protein 7B